MSRKIEINQFEDALKEYLEQYKENVEEEVERTTNSVTKNAINELKENSPKSGRNRENPYNEGWSIKTPKKGKVRYVRVIWNKTNYQLTHLKEFGHATIDGKRVAAQPHIQPIEKKYKEKFVDLLEKKVRKIK